MPDIAIVCGLLSEAKIARGPITRGPGVAVVAAGGDAARLEAELDAIPGGLKGVISFGVAGGLKPGEAPGRAYVAKAVFAPDTMLYPTDLVWTEAIATRLQGSGIDVGRAMFAGVWLPLARVAEKAALREETGATVVDMESHIVAAWAARNHVRFAALRVITDPAEKPLPHAATVGMRRDGSVDLGAIFRSLARDPRQLPALIRTGLEARAAFALLFRCRQSLGPGFAFLDF